MPEATNLDLWMGDGRPGVVLIDGRSGSGKTTLAQRIAEKLGAQQLHLEDLYPGWDGLAEGSHAVAGALADASYRRYDWLVGSFAERVALDPSRPLVIEGCGAVTTANLAAARRFAGPVARGARATWAIWLECPEALRRERALDRDGEVFAPHWERWAAQEDALFSVARPIALVDELVHIGGPEVSSGRAAEEPGAPSRLEGCSMSAC